MVFVLYGYLPQFVNRIILNHKHTQLNSSEYFTLLKVHFVVLSVLSCYFYDIVQEIYIRNKFSSKFSVNSDVACELCTKFTASYCCTMYRLIINNLVIISPNK